MIGPLLPPERSRWARPPGYEGRFLNGMLHVLRQAIPRAKCISGTAIRTRFMSRFGVGLNRVSGVPCCKPWKVRN